MSITGAVEKNEKPGVATTGDKLQQARRIVRHNTAWAMGAGAVPVPLLDVVGITVVQLRMIKQLCGVYGIDFNERATKNLIASLMSSMGSVAVGAGLMGTLLKAVPVVGQTVGIAAVSITAGACVHAIGSVFVEHFNAKGTLENFDPSQMSDYFREEFEKAKISVKAW